MARFLVAVDGSENSSRATRKLVDMLVLYREAPQIDMVTVHASLPYLGAASKLVVSRDAVTSYYAEEGERALAPSAQILRVAGVAFSVRTLVGDPAHVIAQHARDSACDMIWMGTRGMGALPNLVLGSVATKVLHLSDIPVVLVP
ncbi:MAG: universal stress protein [Betaproteobacteria bacterium]